MGSAHRVGTARDAGRCPPSHRCRAKHDVAGIVRGVESALRKRKLAAILAADVVSYSRLMAQDEAGTLARLQTTRRELIEPRVTEHGGRIVKLMGDGTLVEFASV